MFSRLKWTPDLRQQFKQDTVTKNGHHMTETKKRKLHPPELKAKVALEALRGVKTINEIGQEYGVHPVQVGQWKREVQGKSKSRPRRCFRRAAVQHPFRPRATPIGCTAKSGV